MVSAGQQLNCFTYDRPSRCNVRSRYSTGAGGCRCRWDRFACQNRTCGNRNKSSCTVLPEKVRRAMRLRVMGP
jgi:hypothetical protein